MMSLTPTFVNDSQASIAPGELKPTPDSKPVRVVEVDPSSIPVDTADTKKLVAWLRDYYGGKTITIGDTGEKVTFTTRGLKESAKRRGENQRQGYAALDSLLEQAVHDGFEPTDVRHAARLKGQEIYYAAMRVGDKLFAVRFKLDVPQVESFLQYKDHKVSEIEIAPFLSAAQSPVGEATLPENKGTISGVSLGVLRGAVKPSSIENGVLSSIAPGKFLPPRRETRQLP